MTATYTPPTRGAEEALEFLERYLDAHHRPERLTAGDLLAALRTYVAIGGEDATSLMQHTLTVERTEQGEVRAYVRLLGREYACTLADKVRGYPWCGSTSVVLP